MGLVRAENYVTGVGGHWWGRQTLAILLASEDRAVLPWLQQVDTQGLAADNPNVWQTKVWPNVRQAAGGFDG